MKLDLRICCASIILTIILVAHFPVAAADANGVSVFKVWDIPDIVTVLTTALAGVLGVISFIGYRRDQRSKFLLVTLAFTVFALRGIFVLSGDMLALEQPVFDIIASLLDFVVLACFFLAITMK